MYKSVCISFTIRVSLHPSIFLPKFEALTEVLNYKILFTVINCVYMNDDNFNLIIVLAR